MHRAQHWYNLGLGDCLSCNTLAKCALVFVPPHWQYLWWFHFISKRSRVKLHCDIMFYKKHFLAIIQHHNSGQEWEIEWHYLGSVLWNYADCRDLLCCWLKMCVKYPCYNLQLLWVPSESVLLTKYEEGLHLFQLQLEWCTEVHNHEHLFSSVGCTICFLYMCYL